jgi:hypothetical protein
MGERVAIMVSGQSLANNKAEVTLAKDINLRPQGVLIRLAILRGLRLTSNTAINSITSGNKETRRYGICGGLNQIRNNSTRVSLIASAGT